MKNGFFIAKLLGSFLFTALATTLAASPAHALPWDPSFQDSAGGYTVRVQATVNEAPVPGTQVITEAADRVFLEAKIYQGGRFIAPAELRKRFTVEYAWYKLLPADKVVINPADVDQFSRLTQALYVGLYPFIPTQLSYAAEEFARETQGIIKANMAQPAAEEYASFRDGLAAGSLRWKVEVTLTPRNGGDALYLRSPGEERLNLPFDELDLKSAAQVFLLVRRGNTGFRAFDQAVSYLGLPYVWWNGPVESRMGLTCSQLVSFAAFGKDLKTNQLQALTGFKIKRVGADGKFYADVAGVETALEYGKHVRPGSIVVYYNGMVERHTAVIGEDRGTLPGFLDLEDFMLHAAVGGVLSGQISWTGIEYAPLGKLFNAEAIANGLKVIPVMN